MQICLVLINIFYEKKAEEKACLLLPVKSSDTTSENVCYKIPMM
jgi:hypothetical protein